MNIEHFKNLWREKDEENIKKEEFWDARADEFNEHKKGILDEDPIKFIKESQSLNVVNNVLDIGCGPGKYSMKFAKFSDKVLGLDISDKMLEYAKINAKNKNLKNIDFKKVFWEDIDLKENNLEKKFDIVFASMCPGINSYSALEKMINASKGSCFVSGFVKRSDRLLDKLNDHITKKDKKIFDGKKIYCVFNLLWLMGYFPKIKYINRYYKKHWSLDYITDMYTKRIAMGRNLTMEEKTEIKIFLKKYSNNNQVEETIEAKIAWVYWDVKK